MTRTPAKPEEFPIGQVIYTPFPPNRMQFRITEVDGECVRGEYWSIPMQYSGYRVGDKCVYLLRDWETGTVERVKQ